MSVVVVVYVCGEAPPHLSTTTTTTTTTAAAATTTTTIATATTAPRNRSLLGLELPRKNGGHLAMTQVRKTQQARGKGDVGGGRQGNRCEIVLSSTSTMQAAVPMLCYHLHPNTQLHRVWFNRPGLFVTCCLMVSILSTHGKAGGSIICYSPYLLFPSLIPRLLSLSIFLYLCVCVLSLSLHLPSHLSLPHLSFTLSLLLDISPLSPRTPSLCASGTTGPW